MTRQLAALTLMALLLAGCARPPLDRIVMEAGSMAEPAMAPDMVIPLNACAPGDDGIGGTGCLPE